jgi:hypothetical protein
MYPYADELGQLFRAYDRMVLALRDKAALENEVVKSNAWPPSASSPPASPTKSTTRWPD